MTDSAARTAPTTYLIAATSTAGRQHLVYAAGVLDAADPDDSPVEAAVRTVQRQHPDCSVAPVRDATGKLVRRTA